MRRVGMGGLCALAVLAASALGASGASAAEPAFYECIKQAGGKFEGGCDKEGGAGGYTVKEGPGKGKRFTGSGKKLTLFSRATSTCTGAKNEGRVTGPKEEQAVFLTLTGCTEIGKKCTSPGQLAGVVKTNELKGVIGYLNKSNHTVGLDLKGAGGGQFMEYDCEGLSVKVNGSLIGEITPVNTFNTTTTTTYQVNGEGFQTMNKLEGEPEDVLLTSFNGGAYEPSGLEGAIVNKGEDLELKA